MTACLYDGQPSKVDATASWLSEINCVSKLRVGLKDLASMDKIEEHQRMILNINQVHTHRSAREPSAHVHTGTQTHANVYSDVYRCMTHMYHSHGNRYIKYI